MNFRVSGRLLTAKNFVWHLQYYYALSNYVCFSQYLKCMSQVNFKGPDFGASGRGNAGAHMSGTCIFIISKMCSFKLCRFQLVPRTHVPGQF